MRGSRRTKALLVAAAVAGASLLGGAAPATADCVSAEASYITLGSSKKYVVGPKKCVVSTPFEEAVYAGSPVGSSSIVEVEAYVWLPSPVGRRTTDAGR